MTKFTKLHRRLDLLHAFCYKWGLQVKLEWTKAMVLTKQNYKPERFTYNVTLIECVKSFNYLEFQISHNGKWSNLIMVRAKGREDE